MIHRVAKGGTSLKYSHVYNGPNGWHELEIGSVSKSEYTSGTVEEYFAGYCFEAKMGMFTDLCFAGKLDVMLGVEVEAKMGFGFKFLAMPEVEIAKGETLSIAKEKEMFAQDEIVLSVNPAFVKEGLLKAAKWSTSVLGATGALASYAEAAKEYDAGENSEYLNANERYDRFGNSLGMNMSATVLAAATAMGTATIASSALAKENDSAPTIKIEKDVIELFVGHSSMCKIKKGRIELACGGSKIQVDRNGIELTGNLKVTGDSTFDGDGKFEGSVSSKKTVHAMDGVGSASSFSSTNITDTEIVSPPRLSVTPAPEATSPDDDGYGAVES